MKYAATSGGLGGEGMTVQEFYEEVGGNYNEIMSRLRTEERIIKFAGMFARDESYKNLVQYLEDGNIDEAFRAAHTMKRMCQNMAFTRLYESSHDITEILRGKDLEGAKQKLGKVTEGYDLVMSGIESLLA